MSKKNNKRILIFSLAYDPFIGGAEVAIKEITDRIDSVDFVFDMVTLRFDKDLPKLEKVGNVNVYRIGPAMRAPKMEDLVKFPMYFVKVLYPLMAFWKAVSLIRKNNYDAYWSMMSYMGFPVVLLNSFKKFKRPFLLTLQEGDSIDHITKRFRIRLVSFLYKRVFKRADFVQVISNYLAKWARESGFRGKLEVVPNGVNINHFSKKIDEGVLSDYKKRIGKKDGIKIVITASRLVKKNALDDVIKSLKFLPSNIKFVILGDGPDREKLEGLVVNEGVGNRVLFLGHVDHDDLPGLLKASDVFIRPSLSEGMGNSFVEAMAAEVPVVATSVGGIKDFLFDPEKNIYRKPTGLSCEVRNPEDIALKIKRIFDDKELRDEMIGNAKELVVEKYNWDLVAKDMKDKVFKMLFIKKSTS